MMRRGALIASVWACAITGCGASAETPTSVRVPKLVGLRYSEAVCLLSEANLRWRAGQGPVEATAGDACDPNVSMSPDPDVKRQSPVAGTMVRRDSVVRFETVCTLLRFRKDGAACA